MRGVLQVLTLTCSLQKIAAPGKLAIGVFRVMVLSTRDDQPIFSLTIFDVAVGAALLHNIRSSDDLCMTPNDCSPYWIAAALNRTVINSEPALIRLHHTTRYATYPDKWYWYRNKVPLNAYNIHSALFSVGHWYHPDSLDKGTQNHCKKARRAKNAHSQKHHYTASNRHALITSRHIKFGHKQDELPLIYGGAYLFFCLRTATNLTSSRPVLEVHMTSRLRCTPLCKDKIGDCTVVLKSPLTLLL
ncbi:hypothetical protein ARMGADRAFT_1063847 [Armillaria gallica]|uniref:Uncharacterized protein n=1 Tax=Armillaria gallica TaxID=47427 RepID=A0A2H3DDJ4_ARMGA|nr:hypothetical protein ARMGADRAFT_1063847 [Armillaria gallica]